MNTKGRKKSSSRSTRRGQSGTRYDYDRESDVLLITLGRGKPDFAEQKGNVISHYKKDGTPLEIEILNASEMAWKIFETVRPQTKVAV